jgi:hypothetical protein
MVVVGKSAENKTGLFGVERKVSKPNQINALREYAFLGGLA